jgi:hypothetical protein
MASYYIINSVTVINSSLDGPRRLFPGTLISDTRWNIAQLQTLGAELWSSTYPTIATAASRVASMRQFQGLDEKQAESVMRAGVAQFTASSAASAVKLLTTTYTVLTTDANFDFDTTSASFTVTFPASPFSGEVHGFTDKGLHAATNPLTVNGGGNNVELADGSGTTAASVTLSQNGISVFWRFNGTFWEII